MKTFCFLLFLLISIPLFSQNGSGDYPNLPDSARWAIGKNELIVEGQRYNLDCSGMIYAVCRRSGIDILPLIMSYNGGGVGRIYELMKDKDLLVENPQEGDLLFWDNSYDSNGNGLDDDWLTHIGMIVKIAPDGLITYVHHHYRLGIVTETLDPNHPDNPERSSPMRARSDGITERGEWSSAHLLRGYGRVSNLLQN